MLPQYDPRQARRTSIRSLVTEADRLTLLADEAACNGDWELANELNDLASRYYADAQELLAS